MNNRYVLVFDLETSGFFKRGSRYTQTEEFPDVLQLAYAVIDTEEEAYRVPIKSVYFRPTKPIPEGASRVHGLTAEFLEDNATDDVQGELARFSRWVESADVIAGHNIRGFDWPFIMSFFVKQEMSVKPFLDNSKKLYDTMMVAMAQMRVRKWPKLSECRDHFRINVKGKLHDAKTDVEVTCLLYMKLTGSRFKVPRSRDFS